MATNGWDRQAWRRPTWFGLEWHCWHGSFRHDAARLGLARQARNVFAAFGTAWLARQRVVRLGKETLGRYGTERQVLDWHRIASLAWLGPVGPGQERTARLARLDLARLVFARSCTAGAERHGDAGIPLALHGWHGLTRHGLPRHGIPSQGWQGIEGQRTALLGTAKRQNGGAFSPPLFFMAAQHEDGPQYCYAEGLHDAVRFGIDPQSAGEELERIRQRDKTIRPEVVVDEARPEDAVLHPAFEWRDPEAAEKYRQIQARQLIKKVRVICPEPQPVASVYARVAPPSAPIEPAMEQHDPLAHELSKTVGSLVETRRQLTELKLKAARRFDRKKVIAADVALADLAEAEENLSSAHEALTAGRKVSQWKAGSAS